MLSSSLRTFYQPGPPRQPRDLTCRQERLICPTVINLESSAQLVRLDVLPPRTCAVVRSIATDDEDTQRLKTLGVCLGRRVELIRTGDPIILKVFSSRLGISAELAARVHVEVCQPGHCALREADCA